MGQTTTDMLTARWLVWVKGFLYSIWIRMQSTLHARIYPEALLAACTIFFYAGRRVASHMARADTHSTPEDQGAANNAQSLRQRLCSAAAISCDIAMNRIVPRLLAESVNDRLPFGTGL